MAIPINAYSVIVRHSTLAEKYPRGEPEYAQHCPNASYCSDGKLTRIGFMVMHDAEVFVAKLAGHGLIPFHDQQCRDVAICSQHQGLMFPCDWLELGEQEGKTIAWLAGQPPGPLSSPANIESMGNLNFFTPEDIKERMEFVRQDGHVDVYRDKQTGVLYYAGRTEHQQGNEAQHDALYEQACALVQDQIILDNRPLAKLTTAGRKQLDQAIELFGQVIEINPNNWAAMWLLGKIYQRLENYPEALAWFGRAHHVNPKQIDVAREAAIAAMESGQPDKGVYFSERALANEPENAGLVCNLALAVLFSGNPQRALQLIEAAIQLDPRDRIAANLQKIIMEVNQGKRRCPRHVRDLK